MKNKLHPQVQVTKDIDGHYTSLFDGKTWAFISEHDIGEYLSKALYYAEENVKNSK